MFDKTLAAAVLALAFVGCNRAPGSDAPATHSRPATAPAAVTVTPLAEVRQLVKTKAATVLDANNPETRQEYGVVPGAKLLSSSRNYSLSELPGDKNARLVFYCGGMQCRASDHAAKRAAKAGYTRVSVMREGIRGWKKAGAPTQPIPRS